jgi:hypothetical protein
VLLEDCVREARQIIHEARDAKQLTPKILAYGMEIEQRWREYLDNLDMVCDASVTVKVDGQTIRFDNQKDFAEWAAEPTKELA